MPRIYLSMAMLGATLAIGGCNASSRPLGAGRGDPISSRRAGSAPIGPPCPQTPPAAIISIVTRRFLRPTSARANVNQSVYDQIEADLMRAADACAAGRDSEAMSIIRTTKVKHGYHA